MYNYSIELQMHTQEYFLVSGSIVKVDLQTY